MSRQSDLLKAAASALEEGTASDGATQLGHDMAYAPHGPRNPDRWECRNCGRCAYQNGEQVWGSATTVQCDVRADR